MVVNMFDCRKTSKKNARYYSRDYFNSELEQTVATKISITEHQILSNDIELKLISTSNGPVH